MISVEDACRLVTEKCHVPYITHITEVGNIYIMPVANRNGEALCDGSWTVDKITGEVSAFRISKDMVINIKNNGKDVEIPEKYKYPGEIKY